MMMMMMVIIIITAVVLLDRHPTPVQVRWLLASACLHVCACVCRCVSRYVCVGACPRVLVYVFNHGKRERMTVIQRSNISWPFRLAADMFRELQGPRPLRREGPESHGGSQIGVRGHAASSKISDEHCVRSQNVAAMKMTIFVRTVLPPLVRGPKRKGAPGPRPPQRRPPCAPKALQT